MGKKVKKEEKQAPDDVFDGLLVESKNAQTVVLMLESPEEDVLARACEALYRFLEKCDENKKTMLDLGALDHLLRLMTSEDRVVRRNACMAIGVMSAHPDVRRSLRKREESVPILVQLLGPDEDTIVHEFAALCLAYMCNEYSSKVTVFEANGLVPLIACLSEGDPDVQKNAIDAIALMLLDYQARVAVREQSGFPPILELLKSEYAVVQQQALVALARATQDPENRACLRELEGMSRLVEFVGTPQFQDLHTFAVVVLANMLEDPESMVQIKETGGLAKLVALITDTQPAEEEGKGKEKRGASKAGKKDKGDKDDKKGKGEAKPPTGQTASEEGEITPSLPEVKEHAARALARAAKNDENRRLLHESETEKTLLLLLAHENPAVQCAAAQALANMAQSGVSRDAIGKLEGIGPLIGLLKSDSGEVKEAASLALANLTTASQANCSEVASRGGVEPLIRLLGDAKELAVANAAATLTNLAADEHTRADMANRGAVGALVTPLTSRNVLVQARAARAVAAFCCDADSRAELRGCEGVVPLMELLRSGNDDVRKAAAWATCVCAADQPTALEISRYGGLEILQEVQQSSTRRNHFGDAALDRLLDSNLPAKYSLTGMLGPGNVVENGFFDAGPVRPGSAFYGLEVLGKQEVNQRRPVVLVNALKSEKLEVEPPAEEEEKRSAKASSRTASKAGGRDSKMKSRAQREREERQREEELAAQLAKEEQAAQKAEMDLPYTPPPDMALLKMMEEVTEKIGPLATTREQVAALGCYVAEKQGGAIERGQVANFTWELPMSQLKFDLKCNVIPLGMIKFGIHCHRALLFKVLADRLAIPSSLIRGEYNRAWNSIMLTQPTDNPLNPRFPPKEYVVDLVHDPGALLPADSVDAEQYKRL